MKILMVCLGNICRSPLADGLLRKKIADLGLNASVDSAGTANHHQGESPDLRMQKTAFNKGVDISFLKARSFQQSDFDTFDLIYVMDKSNLSNVLRLSRNQSDEKKVFMLLNESHPGMNLEVPDPYYGGERGFEEVYQLVDQATDAIIEKRLK